MKPRTVMAFGAFDLLHPGHKFFLRFAREQGDHFTVIIGRDQTVARLKGTNPMHSETERKKAVGKLGIADEVLMGDLRDHLKHIREKKPDLIVLGYDQGYFAQRLEEDLKIMGLNETKVIRAPAFQPEKWKSSKLKHKTHSTSSDQTRSIAADLAMRAKRGDTYLLHGPVGAGKTVFVQGFLAALGMTETVTSPTYIYELTYDTKQFTVHHLDLYRVETAERLVELGIRERVQEQDSILLIEWPEILRDTVPIPRGRRVVTVTLQALSGNAREVTVTTMDDSWLKGFFIDKKEKRHSGVTTILS